MSIVNSDHQTIVHPILSKTDVNKAEYIQEICQALLSTKACLMDGMTDLIEMCHEIVVNFPQEDQIFLYANVFKFDDHATQAIYYLKRLREEILQVQIKHQVLSNEAMMPNDQATISIDHTVSHWADPVDPALTRRLITDDLWNLIQISRQARSQHKEAA